MIRLGLGALLLAVWISTSRAGEISTGEIISQTAEATFACLSWQPVGLCFWLRCSLIECNVETSLKVGHYNPDLVVSSYNELANNPWQDIRSLLGGAQETVAGGLLRRFIDVPVESSGNRSEGTQGSRDHKNLIYREADAIGHPLALLPRTSPLTLCDSQATAFRPYFLSALDAWAWRFGLLESLYPESLIPGLREVGTWPLNTWGGVYPRTGWSIQAEEPKAAALTAQRAGDIVTRTGQAHVYWPLYGQPSNRQRVWPPGPLIESDARTGIWQMLVPATDPDCKVFGLNELDSIDSWASGRVDEEGAYVWNLWRPYQCCDREGQLFLFDINWIEYPQ